MLQKIAEAIGCLDRDRCFGTMTPIKCKECIDAAKRVIVAMREPTEEMLVAFYGTTPKEQWLGKDWQDMIDEALK